MKLTRERKIYVTILGLGLAVLVTDRLLLADESAETAVVADDSQSLLIAPSPASTNRAAAQLASAGQGPVLGQRLAELAGGEGAPNAADLRDAFRPHHAPVYTPVPDATPQSSLRAERFLREHRLTALMLGGEASAIVDGVCIPVGKTLDGFKLTAIDRRSATFEAEGTQVRLILPE